LAVSVLELRELVRHYPSGSEVVRAVDGVTLTVGAGEFVAVYGPSGSGKTTLLMLAAGLIQPDRGSVHFDGREVSRMSPRDGAVYRRRELGFVFQSFHLMASSSALDNAALKLLGDGWNPAEAREQARPWLERVGLGHRADHSPAELSMGECQRVAIARALVNGPRLLLADEPTGNLDTRRGTEVLALLHDLCHERRIPVLLVTHDPEATAFVDRIHTLRDGHLTEGADAELAAALRPAT
jgi:putative ABC transport system ATP-binding protein